MHCKELSMRQTHFKSHQKKQMLIMRNSFKGFLCGPDIPRKEVIHGAWEKPEGVRHASPRGKMSHLGLLWSAVHSWREAQQHPSSTISWWPWDPDDKQCTLGRQHANTSLLTVNGEWMRGRAVNAFWKEWMNATVFQCIGTLHIYTLELILAGYKNIYFVSSWISFLKSGKMGYFINCNIWSHEL